MQIDTHKVVTLNYTLKDNDGVLIDQSNDGSFAYLHGASNIVPGLEAVLQDKHAGDEFSVTIGPEQAYGSRDDSRMQAVPRSMFPQDADVEPGMQFHAQGPDGSQLVVTVATVADDHVVVDGNHPLAGVTLNFDISVVDVRDATQEEIDHGHVHGPDGHGH
jgi:FKBP-type peptidyl-prolyl cis-trans isomerase SlyD